MSSSRGDRDRDRDGRRSTKKSSTRRRRDPSPESDSYDSYSSESSPERPPRRSKTVNVSASREYASDDDGSYRSSRRHRHSDRDRTIAVTREDPNVYRAEYTREPRRSSRRERDRSYSRSPSPAGKKSIVDDILGAFGLVDKDDGHSSSRRHQSSSSRRRDRDYDDDGDDYSRSSRHGHSSSRDVSKRGDNNEVDKEAMKAQALKAAITAAAIEAWRTRGDKTNSSSQRLMRIASAAIAAGGLDALIDRNPDQKGMRHVAEAIVGGLVTSKSMGSNLERKDGIKNRVMDKVIGGAAGGGSSMMIKNRSQSAPRGSSRRTRSVTPPRGFRDRLKDMM